MRPYRILIVEDEGIVARDMDLMVRGLGYEVQAVASSGDEALSLAVAHRPDLVLMDIVMKGSTDGITVSFTLWEQYQIPVVYVTAYADEAIVKRAKLTEPFGYILKPFDEQELRIAIELALFKAEMQRKLREREEWLSTILKNVKEGVIATDKEGLITFFNPYAEKLSGWRVGEALDKPLAEVLPPLNIKSMDSDRVQEFVLQTRQGLTFPAEVSTTMFQGNTSYGSVLVLRDITERRRAEEEVTQSWKKIKQALEGAIMAIATTIEIKDQYTAGHQRRVSKLSCAIAEHLGASQDRIDGIRVAAEIHDLGKISVPTEILSKPGTLNPMEMAIIRTHPQVGFDILKKIEFPWPIADIVLQHHERMDGSGYPLGLKRPDILLEARILSVADTVEAMSSHRPYRPALSIDEALAEISRNRSRFFDPEIVDACLSLFREKQFYFLREGEA